MNRKGRGGEKWKRRGGIGEREWTDGTEWIRSHDLR